MRCTSATGVENPVKSTSTYQICQWAWALSSMILSRSARSYFFPNSVSQTPHARMRSIFSRMLRASSKPLMGSGIGRQFRHEDTKFLWNRKDARTRSFFDRIDKINMIFYFFNPV